MTQFCDDRGITVRTPAETRNFFPVHANRLWGANSVLFKGYLSHCHRE